MIRGFGEGDASALADLQRCSITHFGPSAYSPQQVAAWLSRAMTSERFDEKLAAGMAIRIACPDGDPAICAGYTILEDDGHLDHLYVHPDHAGRGFARALIADAQAQARKRGLAELFSEVSEIARPAFEKSGWQVEHRRDLQIDGVPIHNYAMRKKIR